MTMGCCVVQSEVCAKEFVRAEGKGQKRVQKCLVQCLCNVMYGKVA